MSEGQPAGGHTGGSPPSDPSPALEAVFRPRAVAVVGASADPKKRGYQAVRALLERGFGGEIYPVNPKGGELLGLSVRPSIQALPDGVDLALICLPGRAVPEALEACGAHRIAAAVVLATGFKEAGEEGAALESAMRETARRSGIRVVGPNTSGVLRPAGGLDLVGAGGIPPGPLALLLQSGNVALALMTEATRRPGVGISAYVGVGNETDLGFHEYLAWLAEDAETRAVLVYADGFREPRAFLAAAAGATREKPIVALIAGRTRSGARATRSHTGAVSSPWVLLRAGLRQAGVVIAERTDELLRLGWALASQPPIPPGAGVAILSDGGAHGALAADALAELGVPLCALRPETREGLREILGAAATTANPVDIGGPADADPEVFVRALELLARDPEVGGVLLVGLFGGYHLRFAAELEEIERRTAVSLAATMQRAGKPIVVHTLYAEARAAPLTTLGEAGVPVVGLLEVACRSVAALAERGTSLARPGWDPALPATSEAEAEPVPIARARAEGRTALTEPEARELVAGFGVELVPAVLCRSAEEAAALAGRFAQKTAAPGEETAPPGDETAPSGDENPDTDALLVFKIVCPLISHKSEAGGVQTGVRGAEAARRAFRRIREQAIAYLAEAGDTGLEGVPGSAIHGVLVAPQLPPPIAEVLVGARREPGLGPVLTLGSGGTAVELTGDVAHRLLPVTAAEVKEMLRELRVSRILEGHRGRPPADLDALVELACALGRTLLACPALAELEANPIFAYPDRAVAVDVRAFLRRDPGPTDD